MNSDETTCPDCAETIKAAARVCKHCGYRIAAVDMATVRAASDEPVSATPTVETALTDPGPSPGQTASSSTEMSARGKAFGLTILIGVTLMSGLAVLVAFLDTPRQVSADDPVISNMVVQADALEQEASRVSAKADALLASAAANDTPGSNSFDASQLSMICRAGIAAEFGRDPKIMTTTGLPDNLMRVSYRRPNDPKIWKYDCKVVGNRIVWRTVDAFAGDGPGRWRTGPNDDILSFKIDGNAVTTSSSDGSSASETYRF